MGILIILKYLSISILYTICKPIQWISQIIFWLITSKNLTNFLLCKGILRGENNRFVYKPSAPYFDRIFIKNTNYLWGSSQRYYE